MKKEEFIKRYGEEAYQEYKKKQAELTKGLSLNGRSNKGGRYSAIKLLAYI